ncbi:MAG: hypothetical protein ACRDLY_15495 [Thermoleophilaceae bacterium]
MRKALPTLLVAVALSAAALLAVAGTLDGPPRWTPDGLFYQARSLELQGVDRDVALERAFQGPLGAELRARDPERSGNPDWVSYNAQFYERRVSVPLAATVVEPVAGERALLDVSIAGYLAAVLAIFGLLLTRFRRGIAAAVTLLTIFLPALTFHSSFPLTDSWGLALETAALASGILVLQRGPRWLLAWGACILVLSFTRDSSWILVLAAAWLALGLRSRVSWSMLGVALATALPVLLLFSVPTRELLAMMLNHFQPVPDASWGFVAERYPGAVMDLVRADGGFVRGGEWYSAVYLLAGLALLFLLSRRTRPSPALMLLQGGALAAIAYVLAVPVFSAFRLELVCVPMAAFGLALGAERLAEALGPQLEGVRIRLDPRARRTGVA